MTIGLTVAAGLAGGLLMPAQASAQTASPHSAAASCGVAADGMLYCGNKANVPVYRGAGFDWPVSGTLVSTYSWFQCYLYGAQHAGGNNIWYYTKGDRPQNGYDGWGYVPAVDVYTSTDPAPGLNLCPVG
jgi:hypothetical protein